MLKEELVQTYRMLPKQNLKLLHSQLALNFVVQSISHFLGVFPPLSVKMS